MPTIIFGTSRAGATPGSRGLEEEPCGPSSLGQMQEEPSSWRILTRMTAAVCPSVVATVHVEAADHPSESSLSDTRCVQGWRVDSNIPSGARCSQFRLRISEDKGETERRTFLSPNVRGFWYVGMLNWAPGASESAKHSDLMAEPAWRRGLACLEGFRTFVRPASLPAST